MDKGSEWLSLGSKVIPKEVRSSPSQQKKTSPLFLS